MADPGIPRSANPAYVDAVMHGRVHPFGHREHVRLAYVLVAQYGVEDAAQRCGQILSHMATAHGAPERFHVTMTVAWVRAVAHHMSEAPDVTDFDGLLERFPQ